MPLDVTIDERNVYAPDVLWYAEGRIPHLRADRPYPVPDLAVEIRSPTTWRHDIGAKIATFDIALEIARGETLTSPLLPGFELALDGLFGSDELPT